LREMIEMKETATKAMNEGTSHQIHRTGPGRDRMLSSKRVSLSSGAARPLLRHSCSSSLSSLSPKLAGLQAKLVVGPADDEYEREADRVAEQAVSMPQTPVQRACPSCQEDEPVQREPLSTRITPLIQRQKAEEEDEKKLQASPMIQRQIGEEEEEEKIQTAPEMAGSKGGPAGPELEQSLEQARGGGRPLAESFRGRMESAFGADFSSVRIHADEPADRLSRSIQARAFTRGHDIFLRQGEYQPASTEGQRLLAHELTHVVQQNEAKILRKRTTILRQLMPGEKYVKNNNFSEMRVKSRLHIGDVYSQFLQRWPLYEEFNLQAFGITCHDAVFYWMLRELGNSSDNAKRILTEIRLSEGPSFGWIGKALAYRLGERVNGPNDSDKLARGRILFIGSENCPTHSMVCTGPTSAQGYNNGGTFGGETYTFEPAVNLGSLRSEARTRNIWRENYGEFLFGLYENPLYSVPFDLARLFAILFMDSRNIR